MQHRGTRIVAAIALSLAVACKTTVVETTNTIEVRHLLPPDFRADVRAGLGRVELLLDERPNDYQTASSAGNAIAFLTEDGFAGTVQSSDWDNDGKYEVKYSVFGNPFAASSVWSFFATGSQRLADFMLRGRVFRQDGGADELVAEAVATRDDSDAGIQFGGGKKTVTLPYVCASGVACLGDAAATVDAGTVDAGTVDAGPLEVQYELPTDILTSVRNGIYRMHLRMFDRANDLAPLSNSASAYWASPSLEDVRVDGGIVVNITTGDFEDAGKVLVDFDAVAGGPESGFPFSYSLKWWVYVRGTYGERFALRGRLYRTDGGVAELVAEATATRDTSDAGLQFLDGPKTAVLLFNCATNVSCRTGEPDTFVDAGNGGWSTSNAAFTVSCSEPPCTFTCSLDNVDPVACSSPFDAGGLTEGQHTLTVRATDDAGRADPYAATISWNVDTGRPTSAMGALAAYYEYGTAVQILGNASDSLSGVAAVQVTVDGGGNWTNAAGTTRFDAGFVASRFSARVQSRAIDVAGNIEVPDGGALVYTTGIPATNVLGQSSQAFDFSCQNAPGAYGLNYPRAVAHDSTNRRLFISDSQNNRVLVHLVDAGASFLDFAADFILGQPSPDHCEDALSPTEWTFNAPWGLTTNGSTLLYVADEGHNRVLVYRLEPMIQGYISTRGVLGQPGFTSMDAGTSQGGLWGPRGLAFDSVSQRLFVADRYNNRVLVYTTVQGGSVDAGQLAAAVLGQQTFTSNGCGSGATALCGPSGLAYDPNGKRLFVADTDRNRVMVYVFDGGTINSGQAAAYVIGQQDFSGSGYTMFERPEDVTYDSTRNALFVADTANHRVLRFDVTTITTDGGELPTHVIGQDDFDASASASGVSQSRMKRPSGVKIVPESNRLFVADTENSRVTYFDLASLSNGMNATGLLGHFGADGGPVFDSACKNGPSRFGFDVPFGIAVDRVNGRLFVSDVQGNRILVFTLDGSGNIADRGATNVLGQPDFSHCDMLITASGLGAPAGLVLDQARSRLYVASFLSNRVVVYEFDGGAITNGQEARWVLGQSTFTSSQGTTTRNGMLYPYFAELDGTGTRLFVGDSYNNRVLVFDFDGGAITNGQDATYVLGQTSFFSRDAGQAADKMSMPAAVRFDPQSNRLFVGEIGNNRVLVFDVSAGITNGMAASMVIGQPGFPSADGGMVGPASLWEAAGVAIDSATRLLFVADNENNRVLAFDIAAITNGVSAVNVIGQTSFLSGDGGIGQRTLAGPGDVAVDVLGRKVYVSDITNHRVLVFDVP